MKLLIKLQQIDLYFIALNRIFTGVLSSAFFSFSLVLEIILIEKRTPAETSE